ncbi:MAG: hypothetical protein ACE5NC_10945 [Anaerolineae bacterium]
MLRFGLGLVLIALVIPRFRDSDWLLNAAILGLLLALFLFYTLIHLVALRYFPRINKWFGTIAAYLPAILVFFYGGAAGETSVPTFYGSSLLVAGVRAAPGCEVMCLPEIVCGKRTHLCCLLFSPIDWLEDQVWKRLGF